MLRILHVCCCVILGAQQNGEVIHVMYSNWSCFTEAVLSSTKKHDTTMLAWTNTTNGEQTYIILLIPYYETLNWLIILLITVYFVASQSILSSWTTAWYNQPKWQYFLGQLSKCSMWIGLNMLKLENNKRGWLLFGWQTFFSSCSCIDCEYITSSGRCRIHFLSMESEFGCPSDSCIIHMYILIFKSYGYWH